jgi:phosphatidylinositol alpha-mannosyltransferase
MTSMRIALVSPYSWSYPGGVTRHIEALSDQLLSAGHHVRVLTPFDPLDRRSARLHRGHWPEDRAPEEHVVPLGRSMGFPANGAVSNLTGTPKSVAALRRELARGRFDVVHLHEPVAPTAGWDTLCATDVPLVGTFHCYSDNVVSNGIANAMGARRRLNRLKVRIAVSEAAAWTGERFYGGHYRIIPNGVDVPPDPLALRPGGPTSSDGVLRIAFVGQAVERKGLPILLRAFEALRDHVPATLTIVGAGPEDVAPVLTDLRGITALGKVDDATKVAVLRSADVLCAPSLGGESFGMVLTEAFAAGTPVVASRIAGYQDVVADGVDGVLVPRGDATALAEVLRDLALAPERRAAMAREAAEHAQRYAWPTVAEEVVQAYEDAVAVPAPATARARAAVRVGARSACRRSSPTSSAATPAAASPAARRSPSREPPRPTPPSTPCSASASTASRSRCSPPARRGCWSPSGSCACRWSSGPCPGTPSCAPRCPTRPSVTPTPWPGPRSGCSCRRRCPRASASPRAPWSWRVVPGARARRYPSCWGRSSPRPC